MIILIGNHIIKPVPEGSSRASYNIAKAAKQIGTKIEIIDIAEFASVWEFDDSITGRVRAAISDATLSFKAKKKLRGLEPIDLIHLLNVTKEAYLHLVTKNKLMLHLFHSVNSLNQGTFRLRRIFLDLGVYRRLSNVFIATSTEELHSYITNRCNVPGDKVFHVPTPIDTNVFHSMDMKKAKEQLNLSKEKDLILYAGSLHLYRGILDVLCAFSKLVKREDKDATLYILAPPREKGVTCRHSEVVSRKIMELKLKDVIAIDCSVKDDKELNLLYNAADVVVMPFKGGYWVSPATMLLEALAAGALVVTSYKAEALENLCTSACRHMLAEELAKELRAKVLRVRRTVFEQIHGVNKVAKLMTHVYDAIKEA